MTNCLPYYLLPLFVLFSCTGSKYEDSVDGGVFKKISSDYSGIDFSNTIQADVKSSFNLFDYDYFYNGSGVGVADINNDGLKDIFFCANQAENKLYLNKGDLKFEDITATAGINVNKYWSSGVTFADVNGDGFLDIYVSQGGPHQAEERGNILLINNGDLTFDERASEFGLDDRSISTQSAFFDYDKDGDLDCVVMNENPLYGVDPVKFHQTLIKDKVLLHQSSSHLYRNDNGKFVDVTLQSGLLRPTFGLGLVVSDINDDGWLDIYMANDYYLPDNMYINNGKGIFIDQVKEKTNQISFYGMGADIADLNHDLAEDIFVLDMASSDHKRSKTLMASMNVENFHLLTNRLGFQSQYMFNTLQLNDGTNNFRNVAHFTGMAKTDWSWAVLMADYDHDKQRDVYITNGYRRYALDNDLKMRVQEAQMQYQGNVPDEVKEELYYSMPSEKLSNILYRNKGDMHFEDITQDWGLFDPSFSNGGAMVDLDNDGDLDLVVNNMDEEAFLYENQSSGKEAGNYLQVTAIDEATSESFAKVHIAYGDEKQVHEIKRVRGYLSAVDERAHFGLGNVEIVDTVRVTWLDGTVQEQYQVEVNQLLEFNKSDEGQVSSYSPEDYDSQYFELTEGMLDFKHEENFFNDFALEVLLPYKQSTMGPIVSSGSVSKNNELVYLGGALGQAGSLYQLNSTGFKKLSVPIFEEDRLFEDMGAVFFDLENDGDLDIYVVSGGNEHTQNAINYQDRLYVNDGRNNFSRAQTDLLSLFRFSGRKVSIIDFDKDGYEDILVGNRIVPQHYPIAAPSLLYRNNKGVLEEVTDSVIPELASFGIVNDMSIEDFDNDGWPDVVAVGEWTHVGFFKNDGGKFSEISPESDLPEKGWWFTIKATDVNNDGLKDFILGNVGKNTKFKASLEKPFKVYAHDFDETGTLDIVLSKEYQGEYVPVRGRECSSQQMPFIQSKYPTYNAFANATMNDIFGEKLDSAYYAEATELSSMLLLNTGNGEFKRIKLPWEAQLFPILSVEISDLNRDGFEDVILGGNIYDTEVETPRLDANSGLVLFSNGSDGYVTGPSLRFPGDVKSMKLLSISNSKYLVVGRNNATALVYRALTPIM